MKTTATALLAALLLLFLGTRACAHASYTGYSGAPGSSGRCAASCHGSSGGSIQVSGFPTEYVPGDIYTLTISHSSGSTIRQFNGSCRVGTGSANAGLIAAGTGIVTYNVASETNGVHLSAQNQSSATFLWTAPAAGTGDVRLYIAGLQGSLSGQNTTLALVAAEQSTEAIGGPSTGGPATLLSGSNHPNPFPAQTTIAYDLPHAAPVWLQIFDATGRSLTNFSRQETAGTHEFTWDSSLYPAGVYFYRLETLGRSETRRMLVVR
jgi:hypothetical protein